MTDVRRNARVTNSDVNAAEAGIFNHYQCQNDDVKFHSLFYLVWFYAQYVLRISVLKLCFVI